MSQAQRFIAFEQLYIIVWFINLETRKQSIFLLYKNANCILLSHLVLQSSLISSFMFLSHLFETVTFSQVITKHLHLLISNLSTQISYSKSYPQVMYKRSLSVVIFQDPTPSVSIFIPTCTRRCWCCISDCKSLPLPDRCDLCNQMLSCHVPRVLESLGTW